MPNIDENPNATIMDLLDLVFKVNFSEYKF